MQFTSVAQGNPFLAVCYVCTYIRTFFRPDSPQQNDMSKVHRRLLRLAALFSVRVKMA